MAMAWLIVRLPKGWRGCGGLLWYGQKMGTIRYGTRQSTVFSNVIRPHFGPSAGIHKKPVRLL